MPKGKNKEKQKLTSPHLEPNQSKKLIKGKGPTSKQDLDQDQRLQTNKYFILWIEITSLSKAILFLFFQTNQNKQRGSAIQAFLRFLPTKEPCQPRRVSLAESRRTHITPNRAKTSSHKTLALEQWIKMWLIVSSSSQKRKHLLAMFHPLLLSWYRVRTFPHESSQAKKPTLVGTQRLQMMFHGNNNTVYSLPSGIIVFNREKGHAWTH